jgi:hypothetical protein
VYWCSDGTEPDLLTCLVHPVHQAGPAWYEVDSSWINGFFLDLRSRRQTVRVQVHTHPGPAGHSSVDDGYSLAPIPGFLSLVLPRFAAGSIDLRGAVLMRMTVDGKWAPVAPEEVFVVE